MFGLSLVIIGALWPRSADTTKTVAAALVAAPLALSMLWPRLTGLKAFGVEISLATVAVPLDAQLTAVLMTTQPGSGVGDLLDSTTAAILTQARVIEVNLLDGTYWWSSRLYLLCAIASDFTAIDAVAFVDTGDLRRYVGLCSPALVRSALATACPELEVIYARVKQNCWAPTAAARATAIASAWPDQFRRAAPGEPASTPEDNYPIVSTQQLRDWLKANDHALEDASISWEGISTPEIVQGIVRDFDTSYVALLRGGKLARLVDRRTVVQRVL